MADDTMKKDDGIFKPRPPVDPEAGHYMVSEAAHFDLQMLTRALMGLDDLCQIGLDDKGPDIEAGTIQPIFHVLGAFAHQLLTEMRFRYARGDVR